MPSKEDLSFQEGIKKQYRFNFRNGMYEGGFSQYKRQGFGLTLLDDGIIYIGGWLNDKVHGRSLVFIPTVGVIYGNYVRGMQIGQQIVKLYQFSNEYFCMEVKDPSKPPKEVIIYYRDQKNAIQAKIKDEQNKQIEYNQIKISKEYEFLINEFDNLSMKFDKSDHFKMHKSVNFHGIKQIKIGFMSDSHLKLNGIGIIIEQDSFKLLKAGQFVDDKLEGIGKICNLNQDVIEGQFNQDALEGKGFYYTTKTNSYIYGIFKKDACKELIQDGLNYPMNMIKKLKQTIHEASLNFFSSSFSSKDLISIDWNCLSIFINKQNNQSQEININSSHIIPSVLDNMNTINTINCNQRTRTNSSQADTQNFENNSYLQSCLNGNLQNYNEEFKMQEYKIKEKRSQSLNSYRFPQNDSITQGKYSKKYTMLVKGPQVDNPESSLNNSKIDFGKLNWGTKPKGEDLSFSYVNHTVEKEGNDLYDCLNSDIVYKKETLINYFNEQNKIPSYQETIKEGELIKKRLLEIQNPDQMNELINQKFIEQDRIQQRRDSYSQSQQNIGSEKQNTCRSIHLSSHTKSEQVQNKLNVNELLNSSLEKYNNKILNSINVSTQDFVNQKKEKNNVQNISEYLRNAAENQQENYHPYKIDNSLCNFNKQNRRLIPHSTRTNGKETKKVYNDYKNSDYSIQFDKNRRSSSISSSNGSCISQSHTQGFEQTPKGQSFSSEKTNISKNTPMIYHKKINSLCESKIKLQDLIDEQQKEVQDNKFSTIQHQSSKIDSYQGQYLQQQGHLQSQSQPQSQQKPQTQQKQHIHNQPQQQKQQQQQSQLKQLLQQQSQSRQSQNQVDSINISNKDKQQNQIKFVQLLGVPHQNKNDQVQQYLKMKEESINKQLQQYQKTNKIDSLPKTQSGQKQTVHKEKQQLESSREIHSQKNNENKLIHDIKRGYDFIHDIQLKQNVQQVNQHIQTNQNQEKLFHYIPETRRCSEQLFTFNNNQSSILSDTSDNQIPNEGDCTYQLKPQSEYYLMKEKNKIKLNNFLNQSKDAIYIQNNQTQANRHEQNHEKDNKISTNKERQLNKQLQHDNSTYSISQVYNSNSDYEQINPTKNKSMVRFNLIQEESERQQSFSYKRQQTPEKSSLKPRINSSLNSISNSQDLDTSINNQKQSNTIDIVNSNEDKSNLFSLNAIYKNQNQWVDLYSVNPQILANTSPQIKIKSKNIIK